MSGRQSLFQPVLCGARQHIGWSRLYGSGGALALAAAMQRHCRPFLVLTSGSQRAGSLIEELHFFLGDSEFPVLSFPDWETLPYDVFSPWYDITSIRLETLVRLPALRQGIIVVPITTVAHRLLPREFLMQNTLRLEQGQQLGQEAFRLRMQECGYRIVKQVEEHGDMVVRGSLIDIFPMGSSHPYRLDLFDETIENIHEFDRDTQRSLNCHQEVRILPAREVNMADAGISHFCGAWKRRFPDAPERSPVYMDVACGNAPAGIEYYLPLFYSQTSSLFDYLREDAVVAVEQDAWSELENFLQEANDRYEQRKDDPERPLLSVEELFLDVDGLRTTVGHFHRIQFCAADAHDVVEYDSRIPPRLSIDVRAAQPMALLQNFLNTFQGRILIVVGSMGRRETLLEMLSKQGYRPIKLSGWQEFLDQDTPLAICVARLERGMVSGQPELAILGDAELFGDRVTRQTRQRRRRHDAEAVIRNLVELSPGDPVVHIDYGVGRYRGLRRLETGAVQTEFILLEYADQDKLYVPVGDLNLVARYTGIDPEHAPLHKLGSAQWTKARQRAVRKAHDVAAELLELHARRMARPGHGFVVSSEECSAFEQEFRFDETPDQHNAIQAVYQDMSANQPMDRLICGDAGFGKTEIAMRAAFIAIRNERQVALLAPTTLLVQQHYQNFLDRFAQWPVRIEMLSRFRTGEQQLKSIAALREGTADIVIGTHRLLQRDVCFSRLGLLIIDEEHRFGVRQKERFKALRSEVDVLALTATPIPRTLNLALSELRGFSVISTPPSRRLAVKTFVREWNDAMVREALLREIRRGGQVFFLHNEVKSIERMMRRVQELLPEARVQMAHGQMSERDLERIMMDFSHLRFNVLVCTTIIETGIDIPTANTIIINRADRFGLAQLYQLRGRVGRSHHRAYAWLIVPSDGMTESAKQRLLAIEALEELGVGFTLATHDLEIRGAGEILGEAQSGHIQEVGFNMYMQMIESAVVALRCGQLPQLDRPLDHGPEINLHVPALIPEDFLPDVQLRLLAYKRIASAKDSVELNSVREEMIDRFGLLPTQLRTLFQQTELKFRATVLGIRRLDASDAGISLVFVECPAVDAALVIRLVQSDPEKFQFQGQHGLRIKCPMPDADSRLRSVHELFDQLYGTLKHGADTATV